MTDRRAVVCGAGGFIGHHLVRRLAADGYWVRGVDVKHPEWSPSAADEFCVADLRDPDAAVAALTVPGGCDEVYQLAADMGGMGFIHAAEAEIMRHSVLVNANVVEAAGAVGVGRYFFASCVCVYRDMLVGEDELREDDAYPAQPDNEYGWEKLYSERMVAAFGRHHGFDVRIARFQNCYGPEGTWQGGREKAPAALCRKVAQSTDGTIEVWGDGTAVRNFIYVADLVRAVRLLVDSDVDEPVNIGTPRVRERQRAGRHRRRGGRQGGHAALGPGRGRRPVPQLQQRSHRGTRLRPGALPAGRHRRDLPVDRRAGRRVAQLIAAAALVAASAACGSGDGSDGADVAGDPGAGSAAAATTAPATTAPATTAPITTGAGGASAIPAGDLVPEVVRTMPHDTAAFTEGYVLEDGQLFESTGLYGESSVREVDPATGRAIRTVPVDEQYFGEGLELVDGRLMLLTWREGTALVFDPSTFELVAEYGYEGEGWGLCRLDDRLVMSNGSDELTFRDPATFAAVGSVRVRDQDDPVANLNELECVDGEVWANVWQTDRIVRIDPTTGQVVSNVDVSGLLTEAAACRHRRDERHRPRRRDRPVPADREVLADGVRGAVRPRPGLSWQ